MKPIVIIGTGHAGYTVAKEFRKLNSQNPLTLITGDNGCVYYKPNLSKALAMGQKVAELATGTADGMAEQLQATIFTHSSVDAIDVNQQIIKMGNQQIQYKELVLAIGASAVRVPMVGDAAGEILSINNLDDYQWFRKKLEGRKHVVIMGGGLIGCEFANDLAAAGFKVSVVEPAAWPLGRMLPNMPANTLQQKLTELGVEWHFGVTAKQCQHYKEGYTLTLSDDSQVNCDVVLSAVGLRPNTQLAKSADLDIGRGIKVDRHLRTNNKHIYAIGDCAEVEGLLLPYIAPIIRASKVLAATLNGQETSLMYPPMPVVVKTPVCPTVVLPPDHLQTGEWEQTGQGADWQAVFRSSDGVVKGFALMGAGVASRAEFVKRLAPTMSK